MKQPTKPNKDKKKPIIANVSSNPFANGGSISKFQKGNSKGGFGPEKK